jgi:hypothetical protein
MRTEPEAEGPASAPASCFEASLPEGASAPDDEPPCASFGAMASVQASVVEHGDPCGEPDVPHAIETKELAHAVRTATLECEASDMVESLLRRYYAPRRGRGTIRLRIKIPPFR